MPPHSGRERSVGDCANGFFTLFGCVYWEFGRDAAPRTSSGGSVVNVSLLKRVSAVAVLAALVLASVVHFRAEGEPDMPPLPKDQDDVYAYYKLGFLPDGMPGRRTSDGLVAHPIYGPYVIADYIRQWDRFKEDRFLRAARRVADAALSRMERHEGALVFRYPAELSSFPAGKYSGLTQSRYLETLHQLYLATSDPAYRDASERVLASLSVPTSKGGVSRQVMGGATIEELPLEAMGTYTLNGWLTAMIIVSEYAEATGSAQAKEIFARNVDALREMLPLFDIPEIANSRYKLAGKTKIRILFKDAGRVESASIFVPGEGKMPIVETKDHGGWNNYFSKSSDSSVTANVLVNYISTPRPNELHVTLGADKETTAEVQIRKHVYTVQSVSSDNEWQTIATLPAGPNSRLATVELPWSELGDVIHPTLFSKKLAGKLYNVYHYMHISLLEKLASKTGEPSFASYAAKWKTYAAMWPGMPLYAKAGVELAPY